jgi:hypothetical protein
VTAIPLLSLCWRAVTARRSERRKKEGGRREIDEEESEEEQRGMDVVRNRLKLIRTMIRSLINTNGTSAQTAIDALNP